MDSDGVLVCPNEYLLSSDEDKLMDLIIGHIIDLYVDSPKQFLSPVLKTEKKENNLESEILNG